jgi:hypothetical protein
MIFLLFTWISVKISAGCDIVANYIEKSVGV